MSALRSHWMRLSLAIGCAVVVTLTSHRLLAWCFLFFQNWYFHKYVQPIDPDPPFLPFLGTSLWIIPQIAAAIGGLTGALVSGRSNLYFDILAGFCAILSWLLVIFADFTPLLDQFALFMWAVGSTAWAVTLYARRRRASFCTEVDSAGTI